MNETKHANISKAAETKVEQPEHSVPDSVRDYVNPDAFYDNYIYHEVYTCLSCRHWNGAICCAESDICNYEP